MTKECLLGLRLCDSEPMHRDDGWLEVGCVFGMDPRLVEWISQHDMSPSEFVLDFIDDAIKCFSLYLSMEADDDNNSVKE